MFSVLCQLCFVFFCFHYIFLGYEHQATKGAATILGELTGFPNLGDEEPAYTPGEWTDVLIYNSLAWNVTRVVTLSVPAQFGSSLCCLVFLLCC